MNAKKATATVMVATCLSQVINPGEDAPHNEEPGPTSAVKVPGGIQTGGGDDNAFGQFFDDGEGKYSFRLVAMEAVGMDD